MTEPNHSKRGFIPADEDVRRQVIETLDRPLVVEAGAGTGKTTLLIARLLYALEVGAVRMPEIVAISFTEKAAAELRLRLRQELELRSQAETASDTTRLRFRTALQELHRAQISTIHAFASSILHERPVEARLDPQFRMLDELESLQLQRTFWNQWLDDELQSVETAEILKPVLLAGVRLEPDLYALARGLYENRDVAETLQLPQAPPDLLEEMQLFAGEVRTCRQHAESNCLDPEDNGLLQLRRLESRLEPLGDLPTSSWPSVFLGRLKINAQAGRREAWRPGTAEQNKEMRRQLIERLERLRQNIAQRVLRGSLLWLRRYLQAYEDEKHRLGVLDFQDLLLHAQRLVREDLGVRQELGHRIRMLCVDEFQDTDPLQAELVLFLAENGGRATHWQDVRVDSRLFLVGDPKQSIYRFRRADLDVYARCCDIVRQSGGEVLDIVQNFRSRPGVLHWVNGVFESLLASSASTGSASAYTPLVPPPEELRGPAVWILRGQTRSSQQKETESWRQQEAQAIARFIQKALHEEWPVRVSGSVRPLRSGDLAVLFARTSGIEHYEDALRAAGIPFRQEGGKLFFQRQEVRDVLHALAACDDPQDELAVVAALRSPLFGISDEELWSHHCHTGGFRYTSTGVDSRLAGPFGILQDLHASRHERGVVGTIERLLELTCARAVYGAQPHGSRTQGNFDTLLRQARAFESARAVGLREFVDSLRNLDEETPRLAEWAPEEDGLDQVRMLTVHMAKGLEFPFVILANLSSRGNPQRNPLAFDRLSERAEFRLHASDVEARLSTEGYEEVSDLDKKHAEAEEHRLLYVAATRARDYLALGDYCGGRVEGYLKALRETPGALGDVACGALGPPASYGDPTLQDAAWCVIQDQALPPLSRGTRSSTGAMDLDVRLKDRRMWTTEHTRRLHRAAAGARRVRPTEALEAEFSSAHPGRRMLDTGRVGLVTHSVLRRLSSISSRTQLQRVTYDIARVHHALDVADEVVSLALAAHGSELEERARAAKRSWRGVKWTTRVGDRLYEVVLDLVFEEQDGVVLIDYTTDPFSEQDVEQWQEAALVRALALASSAWPVTEAGTFFLRSAHSLFVPDLQARLRAAQPANEVE